MCQTESVVNDLTHMASLCGERIGVNYCLLQLKHIIIHRAYRAKVISATHRLSVLMLKLVI